MHILSKILLYYNFNSFEIIEMPNRTAAVAGQNKTKTSITYSKTELTLDKAHEDENKVFRQLVYDIDEGIEVQSYWITT